MKIILLTLALFMCVSNAVQAKTLDLDFCVQAGNPFAEDFEKIILSPESDSCRRDYGIFDCYNGSVNVRGSNYQLGGETQCTSVYNELKANLNTGYTLTIDTKREFVTSIKKNPSLVCKTAIQE